MLLNSCSGNKWMHATELWKVTASQAYGPVRSEETERTKERGALGGDCGESGREGWKETADEERKKGGNSNTLNTAHSSLSPMLQPIKGLGEG